MEWRSFRAAIKGFDANADVFGIRLRIFDTYVKIAVVVEDTGVEQFELWA